MKSVVVVILNWNGGDLTGRCLESLRQSDYANLKCIVIDNGSTDGSTEEIAKAFPEVEMIRNPANLGFAEGCNQGIAWGLKRGADHLLMLNNDTRVHSALVSTMVATAAEHQDRAAVIPKIYWESEPSRLWFAMGRVNLWTGVFYNPAYNRMDDGSFDSVGEAQYGSGCCILMPKEILRSVGGFDRSYFAYVEDVDWSLRCRQAGFPVIFCPTAKLWHGVSTTGKKRPTRYRYLSTRNHLWTLRRHASSLQLLCALLLLPLRSMWRTAKSLWGRDWESIQAEFKGIKDGLLTAPKGEFGFPSWERSSAGWKNDLG